MNFINFERIRDFRNKMNLRREFVSKRTGISLLELEGIENGDIVPTDIQINVLAYIYGCHESFFRESNDKKNEEVLNEFLAFQKEASRIITKRRNHNQTI